MREQKKKNKNKQKENLTLLGALHYIKKEEKRKRGSEQSFLNPYCVPSASRNPPPLRFLNCQVRFIMPSAESIVRCLQLEYTPIYLQI